MIINRSIQLKAFFLLIVFSLNTVVGFACSLGMDMGFNSPHHGTGAGGKGSVHIHKDGKVHLHKPAPNKGHHSAEKTASKKDDCCKGKVVKLQTADKNLRYSKATVNVPVFLIPKVYTKEILLKFSQPDLQQYIACHFHPPPRDIRIDIQSFQI